MERHRQSRRVRGYRIRIYRTSRPSVDLPLIWSARPPEDVWERIKRDGDIVRAVMYRSGRPFEQFQRVTPR